MPEKRHVPLMQIAPLAQVTLESNSEECETCADIKSRRDFISASIDKTKDIAHDIVGLEKQLLAFQQDLRAVRSELTKHVRSLKKSLLAHPHCPLCGVLVGKGHPSKRLVKEPLGNSLVCATCYTYLEDAGVTFADQIQKDSAFASEE